MKPPNYYEILEIARDATPQQIKLAFRALAKKWHPDRHAHQAIKKEATRQMQRINAAHDTLKDSAKRQKYDLRLAMPPALERPTTAPQPTSRPTPRPNARRPKPASSPWQRAATRPEPAPRPTATTPQAVPNPAQEAVSAQRYERAGVAVRAHFDALIDKNPDQKAKLLATMRWQMTKRNSAVRKGLENGQSETVSLARWVQNARRAGNNRLETPPHAPRDPSRPQPRAPVASPLDEEFVALVKAYYDELMQRNPLDNGPLRAALDWQLTRKKVEIARLIRAGQKEAVALSHWAEEARRAADKQLKKR